MNEISAELSRCSGRPDSQPGVPCQKLRLERREPGTVAAPARSAAVKSQIQVYRGKAEECARRIILAKSPRERRQYRKLTDMYRALALGEEPENARLPKKIVKTSPT